MHRYFRLLCLLIMLLPGLSPWVGPTRSARAAPDDPTIVGGDPVPDPNPFVWQVHLTVTTNNGTLGCGGSVITERWILTAAHCIVGDFTLEEITVTVGQRVLSEAQGADQFTVINAFYHDQYIDVATGADIALLELDRPIPNATAYTIPLLTPSDDKALTAPTTWSWVSGWGNTIPGNNQSSPDILRYTALPIPTQQTCRQLWSTVGVQILDSMLCAGTQSPETSSCQGDSGGALVVADGYGGYVQAGIVSFGAPVCNDASRFSVYTRVAAYIDWIEQTIGEDLSTPRAPDLVVDEIFLTAENELAITISNRGTARVALDQGFWVDLYIDPQQAPTTVNDLWNFVGDFGAVWGVDQTGFFLLPGEAITLTIGDSMYWPTHSNLPLIEQAGELFLDITADTPLYVQVDSANSETDYGGILETHELFGGAYQNIVGPLFLTQNNISVSGATMSHRLYMPLITGDNPVQSAAATQSLTTEEAAAERALITPTRLPIRNQ